MESGAFKAHHGLVYIVISKTLAYHAEKTYKASVTA